MPTVEEISSFSDQDQAELIAEHFLKIPNSYEPLKSDDVIFPPFSDNDVPQFSPARVDGGPCDI